MIIGVTLLSSLAAILAAIAVALGGGGWLAVLGGFLVTNWLVALALIAWVVVRDLAGGAGLVSQDEPDTAPTAALRGPAIQELPLHSRPTRSTSRLHA